jgi:hypothetical protein
MSTRPFFVVASDKKTGAIYDLVGHSNLMKYFGNRKRCFRAGSIDDEYPSILRGGFG